MEHTEPLPGEETVARYRVVLDERFEQLPRIIQTFIDRLNAEQQGRWVALPWSFAGMVTVLSLRGAASRRVRYMDIEDDIVTCLDSFYWGHNERRAG